MTTNQEIKLCVSKVCMHLVSLDYYIVCIVGIMIIQEFVFEMWCE